jgi:hypothetical protein
MPSPNSRMASPRFRFVAVTEPVDLSGFGVFGAVGDAQVFAAAAFVGGLRESFAAMGDKGDRFDDHAFAPGGGELLPPGDRRGLAVVVGDVDRLSIGGFEPVGVGGDELVAVLEMPGVIAVGEDAGFGGEDVDMARAVDRGCR